MRGTSVSSTTSSNRSKKESILRKRDVYEAAQEEIKLLVAEIKLRDEQYKKEAELNEVRLQRINRKLAMQLVEIESEAEEQEQRHDIQQVDEWLNEGHQAGMLNHRDTLEYPTFHTSPAQPPPAPPIPKEQVADREHDSILRLADVIVSSMTKQNKHYYELPVFDGNPVEWLSYKRAYEMSSSNYDDHENTTRIQRSLRGEARYVVEDLLRTGTQAVYIIEALQDEFGHPNQLLQNAIDKIKRLPRVSESGVELRHITAVVRNCVYVLKNIKAEGYINNPQITQEVLSKLTAGQRAQYGEYAMNLCGSADYRISPNLCIVLDFLTHITKASSYYLPLCIDNRPKQYNFKSVNSGYMNNNNNRNNVNFSASNRRQHFSHRVHTAVHSRQPAKCAICDSKNHDITNCKSFTTKTVKDRWHLVKTNNLCFKCLVQNHTTYDCTQRGCAHCDLPHHTLLHYTMSYGAPRPAEQSDNNERAARPRPRQRPAERIQRGPYEPPCEAATSTARYHGDARAGAPRAPGTTHAEAVTNMGEQFVNKTLLKVLPVQIYIDNKCIDTYALLDDGATVSLIDSSFVDCDKDSVKCPLKIVSARGQVINDDESCRVTALIRGPNGIQHSISLRTMKNLNLPTQTAPAEIFKQNAHLRDLYYCEMYEAKPMILIGQNHFDLIVNHEIRQGRSGQPVASLTKLGWVIHGPITNHFCNYKSEKVNIMSNENLDCITEIVKEHFELESLGIIEISRNNINTERACKLLDKTSRRVENGWEVGLLWSHDEVHLPDNYESAFKRLKAIENKMDRDPVYAEAYSGQINRLINEKYASISRGPLKVNPVWWLPHFGVTNPNKPNKLRLVYDAAAKCQGTCLNDHLLIGPDLLNSLLGVLIRFRLGPIAYTADIADMFLRISIRKEDRGAQLFLWRGNDKSRDPDMYVMDSMIFGAKSSPTSAIYILNKNASEFSELYPKAAKAIKENHYMDDYLDSVSSVAEARELIADVSTIHAAGGFSIRGWVTNSLELRRELQLVLPDCVKLDKSPQGSERTLGMIWVPESDELAFDLSFKRLSEDIVRGRVIPTKREFLKFIMSLFDPLGFLYPYTIKSKMLLQKVWKSGVGWDEALKENEFIVWEKWLQEVKQLSDIYIPRYFGIDISDVELHVFGDASEAAYASVAFLVGRDAAGRPKVTMVIGKARVAPLKIISIPRLELQAAVLACRLACTVEKEVGIKIARRYLWSDSKTVLKWIHSNPRDFQKFVSHRLAEIDRRTDASEWRWVPSIDNPADEGTKMTFPTKYKLWLTGPSFLYESKENWPANEFGDVDVEDNERVQKVNVIKQYEPLVPVARYSSWTRATRVTARVIAFIKKCQKKQSEALTIKNIRDAEEILMKQSQLESFNDELKSLSLGSSLNLGSKIRELDPFIYDSDGLLRARGRLSAAPELDFNEKYPIILDGRNYITQLIVLDTHKRFHHANHETVINIIRENFWITRLRSTVKSVVHKCQLCRVRRALPRPPKMADLPPFRLENTKRAFVNCGIDYFGPMLVTIGRRHEKRWGVIFTCLSTRAVHIELAASLSTDSAILALRRFIARRGQPTTMYSDRGTNFVGADTELKRAVSSLNYDDINDYVVNKGISWKFNPPAAPHMGGCWERLIRSVKSSLQIVLKERAPKEEVLSTLLAEIEMIINSRPLTYVGSDSRAPVALTPNHLLLGTASGTSPMGTFDASDLNGRKAWIKAQALADMFWKRWLKEYLPTLQRRQKWCDAVAPVKVGDVVLIFDSSQPRNTWPKGVISAVHPGPDGQIRVVTVKTASGCIKRPIVKVALLPTDMCV